MKIQIAPTKLHQKLKRYFEDNSINSYTLIENNPFRVKRMTLWNFYKTGSCSPKTAHILKLDFENMEGE